MSTPKQQVRSDSTESNKSPTKLCPAHLQQTVRFVVTKRVLDSTLRLSIPNNRGDRGRGVCQKRNLIECNKVREIFTLTPITERVPLTVK